MIRTLCLRERRRVVGKDCRECKTGQWLRFVQMLVYATPESVSGCLHMGVMASTVCSGHIHDRGAQPGSVKVRVQPLKLSLLAIAKGADRSIHAGRELARTVVDPR